MNEKIFAELMRTNVRSISIRVDADKMGKDEVTLSASGKSKLKLPTKKDDLSILLASSMEVKAQEDTEAFYAVFLVDYFFLVNEKLDDYDTIVREQCLPIIQTETQKLANKILGDMGHPQIFRIKEE